MNTTYTHTHTPHASGGSKEEFHFFFFLPTHLPDRVAVYNPVVDAPALLLAFPRIPTAADIFVSELDRTTVVGVLVDVLIHLSVGDDGLPLDDGQDLNLCVLWPGHLRQLPVLVLVGRPHLYGPWLEQVRAGVFAADKDMHVVADTVQH